MSARSVVFLTGLLAVAIGLLPGFSQAAQLPLSAEDVFELEWASDPQLSPDGQRVAYVRNGFDIMTDRKLTQLWSVAVAGGSGQDGDRHHRPLTPPEIKASSPRWSPNGDRLAFVARSGDQAQIFVRWSDSGQIARLSRLQQAPSDLAWSPDGKMLAFVMSVAVDVSSAVDMPKRPEGAEWAPAP